MRREWRWAVGEFMSRGAKASCTNDDAPKKKEFSLVNRIKILKTNYNYSIIMPFGMQSASEAIGFAGCGIFL